MADYTPVFVAADHWTSTTSAAVVGAQVLSVSGSGTVAPAAANDAAVVGVAAFDAASGTKVGIHGLGGLVHELAVAAAVTANQTVKAAAAGQVTPWVSGTDAPNLAIGVALTSQSTVGQTARVLGIR